MLSALSSVLKSLTTYHLPLTTHHYSLFTAFLVPEAGLEPAQSLAPPDFESGASASSTTPACVKRITKALLHVNSKLG